VNHTEKYEVHGKNGDHPCGVVLREFDDETSAIDYMDSVAHGSGSWRVVRVMEVIIASVCKA
jgi:hypothetical protein